MIIIAIIPTLIYVYTINELANPKGNIDFGSIIGSYFGLLFLGATYSAIGLFSSSLTKNQIVAFITSICITFFMFYGLDEIADLFTSISISKLGINEHFKSISRGVLDTRDIIYFVSVTAFFLFITKSRLDHE